MYRSNVLLTLVLGIALLLPLAVRAVQDVEVQATPPDDVILDAAKSSAVTSAHQIAIALDSTMPGNLFLYGKPVALTAHLNNSGDEVTAVVNTLVTIPFGALVYSGVSRERLFAHGVTDLPIALENTEQWPRGAYKVSMVVTYDVPKGEDVVEKSTMVGIWDGPAENASTCFGITYSGPLTSERTWHDLDLFKMAGVTWLRFPLKGWLPQGGVTPVEADQYDRFLQEASKRKFTCIAAFTPTITVDPAVNALQAESEYRQSLKTAAVRYGFQVKWWELLRVKPDPRYPELKGIDYSQLAQGRQVLATTDKTLNVIFGLDYPFRADAAEMNCYNIPAAGDHVGLLYNFLGIPEEAKAPKTPPIYELDQMREEAKTALKRTPAYWATDYALDPERGDAEKKARYQAALIVRALILNKTTGVERTFWHHDPNNHTGLAFTNDDGSVLPSLLAMRTALPMLDGVSNISPVLTPDDNLCAFLLRYGEVSKHHGHHNQQKPRYTLVIWSKYGTSAQTIKTSATDIDMVDLWGNHVDLKPYSNAAVFPVDEFPRFLNLGEQGTNVELMRPFAFYKPTRMAITDGGDNQMKLEISNDQQIFKGKLTLDVQFHQWPGTGKVSTQTVEVAEYSAPEIAARLDVPNQARVGQVYDVNADIFIGSRRVGYLTLPVWYTKETAK